MRVKIANFRSFSGTHEVAFPERGLVFIQGANNTSPGMGANGAGKSSLLDAICWCFYGRTGSGMRGPSLCSAGAKKMAVEVEIGGRTIRRAAGGGLLIDGQSANQEQVDALLGANHTQFTTCIYFHQLRLGFLDWTPAMRSDWLVGVYGLERWNDRAEKAAETAKLLEAELRDLDLRLSRAEGKKSTLEKHDPTAAFEAHQARIEQKRAELQEQIKTLQERISGHESRISELLPMVNAEPVDTAELVSRRDTAHARVLQTERAISRLNQLEAQCPVCLQSVDAAHVEKHVVEFEAELETAKSELDKIERELQVVREAERQRVRAEREYAGEKRALQGLWEQLSRLEESLQSLDSEGNPLEAEVRRYQQELSRVQAEIDDLSTQRTALASEHEYSAYWARGFVTLRNWVLGVYVAGLGNTATSYARRLGFPDPVELSISTDASKRRSTGGIDIHAGSRDIRQLSGGEYRRIGLALDCAVSDVYRAVSNTVGIELWDEPMRFLSPDGLYSVLDLLKERAKDRLILLSDLARTGDYVFDAVVKVVKNQGVSEVLYG